MGGATNKYFSSGALEESATVEDVRSAIADAYSGDNFNAKVLAHVAEHRPQHLEAVQMQLEGHMKARTPKLLCCVGRVFLSCLLSIALGLINTFLGPIGMVIMLLLGQINIPGCLISKINCGDAANNDGRGYFKRVWDCMLTAVCRGICGWFLRVTGISDCSKWHMRQHGVNDPNASPYDWKYDPTSSWNADNPGGELNPPGSANFNGNALEFENEEEALEAGLGAEFGSGIGSGSGQATCGKEPGKCYLGQEIGDRRFHGIDLCVSRNGRTGGWQAGDATVDAECSPGFNPGEQKTDGPFIVGVTDVQVNKGTQPKDARFAINATNAARAVHPLLAAAAMTEQVVARTILQKIQCVKEKYSAMEGR